MEHFLVVAAFLLFGVTICLGTLEKLSYCPGMKFEPHKSMNLSVPAIFVLNLTLTRNTLGYLI